MKRRLRFAARVLLLLGFAVVGVWLQRLVFTARNPLLQSGHALLNLESVLGLLFLLLVATAAGSKREAEWRRAGTGWEIVLLPLAMCAFVTTLNAPLLYDAYGQIMRAATEPFNLALREFWLHPTVGDFFYRPLGRVFFSLDYRWAGFYPLRWHLWNLAVHLANCTLLYFLVRHLSFSRIGAIVAALVFALHGSRPEVVAWTSGRFDLLVGLFLFASLLLLLRYAESGRRVLLALAGFAALLALVTKEEAFCVPLLAWLLIPLRPDLKRRLWRGGAVLAAITLVVFVYRWWVLGGIGGYANGSGQRTVLAFNALRSLNLLLLRLWGLLLFPTNWSVSPGLLFRIVLVCYLGGLLILGLYTKVNARRFAAAVAFTLAAMLPAQHLLGIGPDLLGSRVLYVPVAGFAMLFGVAVESCPRLSLGILGGATMLLFQMIQLEHNLLAWRNVALLSRKTCLSVGQELAHDSRNIRIASVPNTLHGVYFLRDAFPDCVRVNSGQDSNRIHIGEGEPDANTRTLVWNDASQMFREAAPTTVQK